MSKMRVFVVSMFYLSVATSFFLLSKWATQYSVKPDTPWKPVDVFITLLLAAPPLFIFILSFSRKDVITSFLTKFHAMHDRFFMHLLMAVLGTLSHRYIKNGPERTEAWFFSSVFLALLLFLVLHSTKEVSSSVCSMLCSQLLGLVIIDLITHHYLPLIASGVPCFVCFMAVYTEYGEAEPADVSI